MLSGIVQGLRFYLLSSQQTSLLEFAATSLAEDMRLPVQRQRTFSLMAKAVARASCWSLSVSYAPQVSGKDAKAPHGCPHMWWALQKGNTELGESAAFVASLHFVQWTCYLLPPGCLLQTTPGSGLGKE